MSYGLTKAIIIAATFQAALILLLYASCSQAGPSVYIAFAPIVGEHKPFTESGVSLEYEFDHFPAQVFITKNSTAGYIIGAEAVYPFPEFAKGLKLFLGFARQQDYEHSPIVGVPWMYSFGFKIPITKHVNFKFRHGSSGALLHGPLCGGKDCDYHANSGWNWIVLDYPF